MTEQHALWTAVQDALDARRDPLEDERVLDELEREPGALDEVLALRARLAAVARPAPVTGSRRLLPIGLAAAAVLAFALGTTLIRTEFVQLQLASAQLASAPPASFDPSGAQTARPDASSAAPGPEAELRRPPVTGRSRVLSFDVRIERTGARGSTSAHTGPQARELEHRLAPQERVEDARLALLGPVQIVTRRDTPRTH